MPYDTLDPLEEGRMNHYFCSAQARKVENMNMNITYNVFAEKFTQIISEKLQLMRSLIKDDL